MTYKLPYYNHMCDFNQSAVVDPTTNTMYCVDNYYYPQSLYYQRHPSLYWDVYNRPGCCMYNRPGWGNGPYYRYPGRHYHSGNCTTHHSDHRSYRLYK